MVNTVRNFLIMLNNLQQIQLKLFQKINSKTAEANLIDKISKVSEYLPQNSSRKASSEIADNGLIKKYQCIQYILYILKIFPLSVQNSFYSW